MSPQEAPSQTPLIPSDRVDELAQLIKDSSVTPMFALKINEGRTPSLTSTKLGGLPYWPQGMDYPTTKKGIKLMLLAQLRLEEFCKSDRLPSHGLLQFFVDSDDDCSGMDFDDGTVTTPCRLPGASMRVMAATFPLRPVALRRVRSRRSSAG